MTIYFVIASLFIVPWAKCLCNYINIFHKAQDAAHILPLAEYAKYLYNHDIIKICPLHKKICVHNDIEGLNINVLEI